MLGLRFGVSGFDYSGLNSGPGRASRFEWVGFNLP